MFFCFFVCCFLLNWHLLLVKSVLSFCWSQKLGIAIKDLQSTSQLFKKPDFNNLCE